MVAAMEVWKILTKRPYFEDSQVIKTPQMELHSEFDLFYNFLTSMLFTLLIRAT